jgi:hypothetical protein
MKIRIRGNSVRLRLTRTEVDTFNNEGYLEEKTNFGFAEFIYAIESLPSIDSLQATFVGNKLTVFVPDALKKEWVSTDLVGLNHKMDTGGGNTLSILVEKDWACIDNVLEDQSDNYPNPNKC